VQRAPPSRYLEGALYKCSIITITIITTIKHYNESITRPSKHTFSLTSLYLERCSNFANGNAPNRSRAKT